MKEYEKPSRPVDIKMLIDLLSYLPPDTLVFKSTWQGIFPLDRCNLEPNMGPILVYEKDGEVKLYIDDGEAFHDDDKYTNSLFWAGGAMGRITKLGEKEV